MKRRMRSQAVGHLAAAWLALHLMAADRVSLQDVDVPSIGHQTAPPGFAGEACVAMAWSAACGQRVDAAAVFELTSVPLERGSGAELPELAAAARRAGFAARLQQAVSAPQALAALHHDLQSGAPSVVSLQGMAGRREQVLVVGFDSRSDSLVVLDPGRTDGRLRVKRSEFLRRWPDAGRVRRLPLISQETAEPPAVTAHSRLEYASRVADIRRRTAGRDFQLVVERPFVVIGDLGPAETRRWAGGTVRWAVRQMKECYFARDPTKILEIWLFDGRRSYQKHVRELFGDRPGTPYGYYSPRHRALIMNIQTGGGTLVHEILHPFMEANFPRCPSWFNEGLASLYEQCGERNGRIWGRTNWRLAGLQRAIASDANPSFPDLCSTTTEEFYDDATGVHYSQARYLCYYLQEQGRLREFYHQFRRRADQDPTGCQTLREVLQVNDLEAFQQQWEEYVLDLRFP